MRSIVPRLIYKDLYLHRGLISLALVAGSISLGVSTVSITSFTIGNILYVTTVVALGIILVMYGVAQERKDKALLFVLSLPVSRDEYLRAKVIAMLAVFAGPWAVLLAGGLAMILLSRTPDGMIPMFVLVSGFMMMNFCVILAATLTWASEGLTTIVVIVTNVSVSLFFMMLANIPSFVADTKQDVIHWDRPFALILSAEVAVTAIALALPFLLRRQRSLI